jgi:flagellar biosynthesis chaperone FliJ
MSRVLDPLLRLKSHQRRQSTLALRAAEAEREAQAGRVSELRTRMTEQREEIDPSDGNDLVAWSAWRLQAELSNRRESMVLAQRSREVEIAANKHRRDATDEMALDAVIRARAEAELEEEKREEARTMDEIAVRRAATTRSEKS